MVAYTLLFMGTGLVLMAFGTDFWSEHTSIDVPNVSYLHRGLYRHCQVENQQKICYSRYSDQKLLEDGLRIPIFRNHGTVKSMRHFESVLVILDGISLVLALNALLFGLCACANKCAIFTLIIQIFCSAALSGVCGAMYYEHNKKGLTFPLEIRNGETVVPIFTRSFLSWSFFMSIFGSFLQFLSCMFYIFGATCCHVPPEKRRSRSREVQRPSPALKNVYVNEKEVLQSMSPKLPKKPVPPNSPVPKPPRRFQIAPTAPNMTISDIMEYYEDIFDKR
ncbi:unnamed protein product [Bursaphelenchus xylophilus]|uniref:(pine wood nematode) hypothetical protein n=1 Tax=Bursaphelenchus xylophilus TaxID=6326 RepID=A0A1I7SGT2_BURXY|nr:unnamed protein product [Bursaphelenchus xylophilus]CAG9109397.1 unnamed protein product [Bursaphelenchus xylophilus]